MSSISCPRCGSRVLLRRFLNLANKPFCERCGWNLDRAEAALAGKTTVVRLLPMGIAAIGLFGVFAASRAHSLSLLAMPALFGLVTVLPLWNYYSARRAIAAAKSTVNPGLAMAQLPLDPSLQILQSRPRPRQVRFRFQGGAAAVAVTFSAFAILSSGLIVALSKRPFSTRDLGVAPLLPFLFIFLVIVVVLGVPYFRDKRNIPLLRDGELAFACVVIQRTVQQGKTSYSWIEYEFKSNTGQLLRNSSRDVTCAVFEDMSVPVFYDPLDPSKNVALCATHLKIVDSFGSS